MTNVRDIARKAVKIIVVIELCYLVVINSALQLSLTQDLVNLIRPEKFQVSWDSAWSGYPFRVYATGIAVNGQSRSQQWELHASSASGSISLLPLVLKHVTVSSVSAEDVDYRQRPRLKSDRDYSNKLAHFPPITGREIISADTSQRTKKRPWKVFLRNMRATGQHSFWIHNMKGSGIGSATADLSIETRGGPFSLDVRELGLELHPAYVNSDTKLYDSGVISGKLGFTPFVPRENKGLKMLPYVYMDTQLDLAVGSLGFINLFTSNLSNMVISGAGQVRGRLAISEGYMRAGTDLTAGAEQLGVTLHGVDVAGRGVVAIHTPADADKPLGLDISYDSLNATRLGHVDPFLEGHSLNIEYRGSNFIAPDPDMSFNQLLNDERSRARRVDNTFTLLIDDASVLDMSVFNEYLPPEMPLTFTGGTASLDADVFLGVENMSGEIQLDSNNVEMRLDDQGVQGDLAADINIAGGVPREFRVDLSGSTLTLDDVSVEGDHETFEGDYWSAVLDFHNAEGVFLKPLQLFADADLKVSDTRPLVALFDNRGDPPNWISELMTMKDLEGEASLTLSDGRFTIPLAYVTSDTAEVAAKAVFSGGNSNGVIYARYNKLDLLLKTKDGNRNLDIINVREKFDRYELPLKK
ncbi:MAG: hypothetical protein V7754_15620 [Halioglobus sp.]